MIWTTPPQWPPDCPPGRGGPAADFTDRPAIAQFAEACARTPDHVALAGIGGVLTYAQARARVAALATRLMEGPDAAPVALLLPHGPDVYIAVLACLAAGRVAVPLNPAHPAGRNALIPEDAGATTFVVPALADCAALLPGGLPPGATAIAMDALAPVAGPVPMAARALGQDAPAFVFYTSGSTGRPKGIAIGQRAALARGRAMILASRMDATDCFFIVAHPSAIPGVAYGLAVLLTGARLLQFDLMAVGARTAFELFRHHRITLTAGFPTLVRMLCRLDGAREALATLRMLRSGGEKLLSSDLAVLRAALPAGCGIMPAYASTEGMHIAHWVVPPDHDPPGANLSSGYLESDHDYAILDPEGRPVAPGELVLRSRNIAAGEWVAGRCVPGRLAPDPDDPTLRIFRTGDLVRLDAEGMLHVLGRADRQIKVHGQRIEPAEIEAVLRAAAGVADAAVLPFADGPVTRLLGFVAAPADADTPALRAALQARLAAAFTPAVRPVRLHILADWPRLPGGKVDSAALLALDAARPGGPSKPRP